MEAEFLLLFLHPRPQGSGVEMQDGGKIGTGPAGLEQRLNEWGPLYEADGEVLRKGLDGDPRIAALLLARMEHLADPNSIFKGPPFLVNLLLGNKQTKDAARFALRSGAYQSSGELGLTTELVLPLFDDPQERERAYRWSVFRLARLDCWRFFEDHPDFCCGDWSHSVMLWIAGQALKDATWIPLLLVIAKRGKGNCSELLMSLAAQPKGSLDEFDLGDLAVSLDALHSLVEGISDPVERVRCLASATGHSDPNLLLEPMLSTFPAEKLFDHVQVGGETAVRTSSTTMMDSSRIFLSCINGFEKWFQTDEERRQLAMQVVVGAKDYGLRTECVDRLAFWFGEHPQTFLFLAEVVRASTRPEDLPRSASPRFLSEVLSAEKTVRSHCMKVIGFRWPGDERAYALAKEALGHPWREVRRAAALLLCREHAGRPETEKLIAGHIGDDAILFGEFTALVRERHEGMVDAVRVLEQVGTGTEFEALATDGPAYLISSFGPRKDLRESLANLSSRTSNEDLRSSIARVMEAFFK